MKDRELIDEMLDIDSDNVGGRAISGLYNHIPSSLKQEIGSDINTKAFKAINVYKFRKVSGILKLTNHGEQSIKYSQNRFQQATDIYTGNEPIVVIWEDSLKATVDKSDNLYKKVKVGTYYKCYFQEDTKVNLRTETINILGKDYVNNIIEKEIRLTSFDWEPTDDDMLQYVYLILDKRNQSLQWLEISSYTPTYDNETREFISCEIEFENINLKYSRTGKTLIDFLQFGGISEGYCFPKETYNEDGSTNVELDKDRLFLKKAGTNQIQFDFNCGAAVSSFFFIGRKKEDEEFWDETEQTIKLDKPHILLPYKAMNPKSNDFFYLSPNNNYYVFNDARPSKLEIWGSYQDAYKGNNRIGEYNIDKTKQVLTGFKYGLNTNNTTAVRNTNPQNNNQYEFDNWYNKKNVDINLKNVDMNPIPYVKKGKYDISLTTNYVKYFTINTFLNWNKDVINYDYREITKYKLTNVLGILGSLVNIIVGGLDIGWTSSRNYVKNKGFLNFVVPCISFEDGMSSFADGAPLPPDIFIDDNVKKVLPTATNVLTSWNFTLTDRFLDKTQIPKDTFNAIEGKGKNGIWHTKYIGQKKDEEGNFLKNDETELYLDLNNYEPYSPSQDGKLKGWIIDYVDYFVGSQCNMRISAYASNGENIYSLYTETNAKARDEFSIWRNSFKFNYYDEINTIGQAAWPENVEIPKPDPSEVNMSYNIDKTSQEWLRMDVSNTDEGFSWDQPLNILNKKFGYSGLVKIVDDSINFTRRHENASDFWTFKKNLDLNNNKNQWSEIIYSSGEVLLNDFVLTSTGESNEDRTMINDGSIYGYKIYFANGSTWTLPFEKSNGTDINEASWTFDAIEYEGNELGQDNVIDMSIWEKYAASFVVNGKTYYYNNIYRNRRGGMDVEEQGVLKIDFKLKFKEIEIETTEQKIEIRIKTSIPSSKMYMTTSTLSTTNEIEFKGGVNIEAGGDATQAYRTTRYSSILNGPKYNENFKYNILKPYVEKEWNIVKIEQVPNEIV